MAPVTLNEATVMAVRRIDIRRVQHLRCKVQHSSKKTKQRRATFRIGCRYLKWTGTMMHHSPGMVNRSQPRCSLFNVKIHVTEKRWPKNFRDPIEVRIAFFWVWNYPLTAYSRQSQI